MLNWDDLKYFIAVSRTGSVRAAGQELGVNHATVSRRINSFEQSLGERLFDRTAKGYVRTRLGDEIFNEAAYLEDRLSSIERKLIGSDDNLQGEIRITMPELLGQHLLMAGIAEFSNAYPNIELHLLGTNENLNLANREADVAFRICDEPPEYLIGRKLAVIHRACYMARKDLPKLEEPEWLPNQNWIGWTDTQRRPIGKLAREYPKLASKHKISNSDFQITACAMGMGISILPCLIGDAQPELVRIPPYVTEDKFDLWILSHPDLRKNAKIQAFVRFMTDFIVNKKPLIEGQLFERP